jgi:hypothetical protein
MNPATHISLWGSGRRWRGSRVEGAQVRSATVAKTTVHDARKHLKVPLQAGHCVFLSNDFSAALQFLDGCFNLSAAQLWTIAHEVFHSRTAEAKQCVAYSVLAFVFAEIFDVAQKIWHGKPQSRETESGANDSKDQLPVCYSFHRKFLRRCALTRPRDSRSAALLFADRRWLAKPVPRSIGPWFAHNYLFLDAAVSR